MTLKWHWSYAFYSDGVSPSGSLSLAVLPLPGCSTTATLSPAPLTIVSQQISQEQDAQLDVSAYRGCSVQLGYLASHLGTPNGSGSGFTEYSGYLSLDDVRLTSP